MTMNFRNLNARIRVLMAQEVDLDISTGNLYFSKRFTDTGRQVYPSLLLEAVKYHNDDWLAQELNSHGCFKTGEVRRSRNGNFNVAHTPFTAGETLAEGEFNRFYMRGLCVEAMEDRIPEVVVYRGKYVEQPRPESEALIGMRIPASKLLEDLRSLPGSRMQYGIPAGPNSGLTICLPETIAVRE